MHSLIFLSVIFTVFANIALAAPIPSPWTENIQKGNSYTGSGGQANGGNVESDSSSAGGLLAVLGLDCIELYSNNGGDGGDGSSGAASAHHTVQDADSSPENATKEYTDTSGNAFSGVGGTTNGGSVTKHGKSCVSLASNNGGKGGNAPSGPSNAAGSML